MSTKDAAINHVSAGSTHQSELALAAIFGGLVANEFVLRGLGFIGLGDYNQQMWWSYPIEMFQEQVLLYLITLVVCCASLFMVLLVLFGTPKASTSSKFINATKVLSGPSGREKVSKKAAAAKAKDLNLGALKVPGIMLGTRYGTNHEVWVSWEDTVLLIAGPRTGKTVNYALPTIIDAPGLTMATSNKRDIVDATKGLREALGSKCWVFDPQGIFGEERNWYWNPLTYVTEFTKAVELATIFIDVASKGTTGSDPFWQNQAKNVLANYIYLAAESDKTLVDVYNWVKASDSEEPIRLAERYGLPEIQSTIQAFFDTAPQTKSGFYSNAQQALAFLDDPKLRAWITPNPDQVEFLPHEYVKSSDTLYSLSKEGSGDASGLVTALTAAVIRSAERHANTFKDNGGRLPIPFVVVLDEVANVCKWRELPDMYSHFGSRGIVLMSILQSWSQGVGVWGDEGMKKLYSAANFMIYGGGVREVDFLRNLSESMGTFKALTQSRSASGSGSNLSASLQDERVLSPETLMELPKQTAVVLASQSKSMVIKPRPWWEHPKALAVKASLKLYEQS
jgi:type IV secretory pathway TraG/TraD family ATPase VirD4